MKKSIAPAIPLFLLVLIAGCGKSSVPMGPGSASSADQSEVSQEVSRNSAYVDEPVFESSDPTSPDASAPEGALAAIRPLRFWREIREVRRSFEFAFADTDSAGRPATAVVTVRKAMIGSFNILAGSPEDTALGRSLVRKPLHDQWVRRVLLRRVPGLEGEGRRWRVAGVSGVQVTSRQAATWIQSLRIRSGALDTTITDALALQRLRQVLAFDAGAEVELTVTTLQNDDVVVLQHRDGRFRFVANGDHTYTGRFSVRALAGLHHVGVNALSHGTLFDDQAAYDSQAWILPYVVRPDQLADLVP